MIQRLIVRMTLIYKSSQLTQPGRNFWLCFNVLREFSDNSVNSGKEGCWLYWISKGSSGLSFKLENFYIVIFCWCISTLIYPSLVATPLSFRNPKKNVKIRSLKIKENLGTSLVVLWLRTCLPMQGMQLWSPVWKLRSPHAMGQLSRCITASEPTL